AEDAMDATRKIRAAIDTGVAIETDLFKRGGESQLREIFARVSVPNVSDAWHRRPPLAGVRSVVPGARAVGPAYTVRTAPGDWAKPVEAIDHAPAGAVVVIDAGGVPPAIWGELATYSSIQRKLAGVV